MRGLLILFRAFVQLKVTLLCLGVCLCLTWVLSLHFVATAEAVERVGDVYAIEIRETQESSANDATGKSSSQLTIVERVTAISGRGVELEYDLAENVPVAQREQTWQLPIRIVRTNEGELELKNETEIEERLKGWMNVRAIEPTSCGVWSMTWVATKTQCDAASALEFVSEAVFSASDFVEGREVNHVAGVGTSNLIKVDSGFYYVNFPVDQDYVMGLLLEEQLAISLLLEGDNVEEAGFDPDSIKGSLTIELVKSIDGVVMEKRMRLFYEVRLRSGVIRRDKLETIIKRTRRVEHSASQRGGD